MTNNQWVLILGANSDIAISCAKKFAKEGYNLYLASRNEFECEKNASNIALRYQIETQCIKFDAIDFQSHNLIYQNLKIKPVGVIVAFGFMASQIDAQKDFNLSKCMIDTNYVGSLSILEVISSEFEKRKSGFIIGISSVAGDRGRLSNYIYGSTKAAFTVYLAGLRHRLVKSNIHVLTVKPGFVLTKMTEGLDLPKLLTSSSDKVADAIYKAANKKKPIIYVSPIWRYIMLIIIHLPNFIFNRTKL
jgi:decaprenylphospho-beta-D-erythro-pentofuranosid-2-ulose 2-reductase